MDFYCVNKAIYNKMCHAIRKKIEGFAVSSNSTQKLVPYNCEFSMRLTRFKQADSTIDQQLRTAVVFRKRQRK